MSLAFRIAARELRGGLRGLRVFLICLALGVAAIAGVATLRASIQAGLADQGSVLLGGDAEMRFTYRFASDSERAFMATHAARVSEIVDFRSMAITPEDQALTQVKAIDTAWPLYGTVTLDPAIPLDQALEGQNGLPGAVLDPLLIERLGLAIGGTFSLGTQSFVVMAALIDEPDTGADSFSLGPRSIVATPALATSGLLAPGTLYETKYRLALAPGTDLETLEKAAKQAFQESGMRWTDSRRPAPGIERFIDRMGSFLVLVGLAGLAVGGVGISAAVRAWLQGKEKTIATLKTIGASSGLIFSTYLIQVAVLTLAGIVLGLIIGAGVPLMAAPWIEASLPFPAKVGIAPAALGEAAFYGALTALIFTLLPLARAERIRAAALYRGGVSGWPRKRWLALLGVLIVLLVVVAVFTSGIPELALGTAGGVLAALAVLALAAWALRRIARRLSHSRIAQGRPGLRAALAAIGGPGSEALPVILSLGLGLSVLAAVGQIDANLRAAIDRDLPTRAPAFFFVDIQPDQIDPFIEMAQANSAVSQYETAPMLRGVVTGINGRPAREVIGEHWIIRGDRGVSYAAAMPEGTKITAGSWWPEAYQGAPQISLSAQVAEETGLKIGDEMTVNILGRDITGTITSLREVDFSNAGMGFVIVMNEAALRGAPHSHIATLYAPPEAEATILREVTKAWPNITAIRIREAVDRVSEALSAIATATAWAAAGTLLTGFAVLIGTAAAGERRRAREAAILKVLGATRARIIASFTLRAAILGLAAGLVAVVAGAISSWAVMYFVMESSWRFEPVPAALIILGGVAAVLLAGLVFAGRTLAVKPAQVLREDG
ncbi:ABC transporter permease [Rhodobacter sp. 24-YEA-8]|uniref:ABC transporter permease n=1 Tax=Rhodobacter sp. 24-YEA-8 TaxID=1884310 RepID=UPI000896131F|nr:FtsX-like permease family protein [Rhodobacter sp. 24-YEA-8]SEC79003.1 putative ABC transport system permease protein [Rhodobacter sp. 24-YEA-8]